jgi:hypothetical protein
VLKLRSAVQKKELFALESCLEASLAMVETFAAEKRKHINPFYYL